MRRVLTNDGSLFHYIGAACTIFYAVPLRRISQRLPYFLHLYLSGNPDSKESGRLYRGIATRLQEAGFSDVKKVSKAFGLVASAGKSMTRIRYDATRDDDEDET